MPASKKKGKSKGKSKGKKRSPNDAPSVNEIILKRILKLYDQYSIEMNSKCCPDVVKSIKSCLEDDKPLDKILVRPIEKDLRAEEKFLKALKIAQEENDYKTKAELKQNYSNTPLPTYLEPLMRALKEVQFSNCMELYVIDLPLFYPDIVQLTHFIKIPSNLIRKIEIQDCMLQTDSIKRFSTCFNYKRFLTSVCLDYNEFGDRGCLELCKGLAGNTSLLSLSLNYCNLQSESGSYLGEILSTTALRELYLDGNYLRCQGAYDLIRTIAEEAENVVLQKELEEKAKLDEEARRREEEEKKPIWERQTVYSDRGAEYNDEDEKSEKKKKRRKKKKKKSNEPPPVGPFVYKLHLADNGIDVYEDGSDKIKSLEIIHQTIETFTKLIKYSPDVEEIDLHNNTIGNMSATMILNALEYRKIKKVGKLAMRVSEKIDKNIFSSILKLSKKMKKKKGKKKKKVSQLVI